MTIKEWRQAVAEEDWYGLPLEEYARLGPRLDRVLALIEAASALRGAASHTHDGMVFEPSDIAPLYSRLSALESAGDVEAKP